MFRSCLHSDKVDAQVVDFTDDDFKYSCKLYSNVSHGKNLITVTHFS